MYEDLVTNVEKNGIEVYEMNFSGKCKGLYADGVIAIDSNIETDTERSCILAEEVGHYITSTGNILDQNDLNSIKQEKHARNWAYEKLASLKFIIKAYENGAQNRYELASYLNVTEDFIQQAINHYKDKYGLYHKVDNYIIYFDPLYILVEL